MNVTLQHLSRLLLCFLVGFSSIIVISSCGSDDDSMEEEMDDMDCSGKVSFELENQIFNFDEPLDAVFKFNEPSGQYEFLVNWQSSQGGVLGFQILSDISGEDCFGMDEIIDLNNLENNVSILSLQYNDIQHSVNASRLLDNSSGFMEFTSCDPYNKILSFNFEFSGGDIFGNNIKDITNGSATNVCYTIE